MTGDLYRRYWFSITIRDLIVIGACLTVEWSSLPAFALLAKKWKTAFAKRKKIMSLRRAEDQYLAQWIVREESESTMR
jgi:hypothetical protein